MKVKTKFLSVRVEDISALGKNEKGSLFVVFKSGAQHHIKYDDPQECEKDWDVIEKAMDDDYGPKLVPDDEE